MGRRRGPPVAPDVGSAWGPTWSELSASKAPGGASVALTVGAAAARRRAGGVQPHPALGARDEGQPGCHGSGRRRSGRWESAPLQPRGPNSGPGDGRTAFEGAMVPSATRTDRVASARGSPSPPGSRFGGRAAIGGPPHGGGITQVPGVTQFNPATQTKGCAASGRASARAGGRRHVYPFHVKHPVGGSLAAVPPPAPLNRVGRIGAVTGRRADARSERSWRPWRGPAQHRVCARLGRQEARPPRSPVLQRTGRREFVVHRAPLGREVVHRRRGALAC